MGSIHEKNRGRKSRATVPVRSGLTHCPVSLCDDSISRLSLKKFRNILCCTTMVLESGVNPSFIEFVAPFPSSPSW
jgi:hypothetical protein